MLTVVIIDRAMSKWLDEFKPLIDPLVGKNDVVACDWDEQSYSLHKALPDLKKHLKNVEEWRALFVIKPNTIHQSNPYDFKGDTDINEFKPDTISHIRITRLLDDFDKTDKMEIPKPLEIMLICPRIKNDQDNDNAIKKIERKNDIASASSFWELNGYSSTTRFLIYDIVNEYHTAFKRNLVGFVSALTCIMTNEIPPSLVQAYRIYTIKSSFSDKDFINFCNEFYTKMIGNKQSLEKKLAIIKKHNAKLYDEKEDQKKVTDAERIDIIVPDFRLTEFAIDRKGFGLTNNCPKHDRQYLKSQTAGIYNSFEELRKKPRKTLDKSIDTAKRQLKESEVIELDKYQKEDIEEKNIKTCKSIYSREPYSKYKFGKLIETLRSVDMNIFNYLKKRINRKTAVITGLIIIVLFLLSFASFVFDAIINSQFYLNTLGLILGCAVALGIVSIDYLYWLKSELKKKLEKYNDLSQTGAKDIVESYAMFGTLLTEYTSFRINKKLLDYQDILADPKRRNADINKHLKGLNERIEMCELWLAAYDTEPILTDVITEDIININIPPHRCSIYYPAPNNENKNLILNPTNDEMYLPYDYIKALIIEREVIFDE